MSNDGYIKIYRSSMESKLYLAEPFTKWQAWCDLLFLAYYADSSIYVRGIKVDTKRGCVYKATEELAKRWKWSRGKVLRFLDELEMVQQIVQQKSNVINCISITNYDRYQSDGTTNSTTDGTTTQKKEAKKSKEEYIPPYNPPKGESGYDWSVVPQNLKPIVEEWLKYKREKKQNYKPTGFKSFCNLLNRYSGGDEQAARLIVEQSMANNWAGIFELKTRKDGADRQSGQQSTDHPSNEQLLQQTRELINAADEREKQGYNSQILPF